MNAIVCNKHEEFEAAGMGAIIGIRQFGGGDTIVSLGLKCPKCGEVSAMTLDTNRSTETGKTWHMEGWPDSITLTPSIHHNVPSCGYHGHLKNGVFTGT